MLTLSARAARRVALAASGLLAPRPHAPTRRHLLGLVDRLGLLQMDSVSILARAHYLPGFSRLGAYDPRLLDEAAWGRRRVLFEYWGHEASLLPIALQPDLRWRMERAASGEAVWGQIARFGRERPQAVAAALAEIADRGPLAAGDLTGAGRATGPWWGRSDGKLAVEYLFWCGRLCVARRRGSFERVYDLPERVLPAAILDRPTPAVDAAQRRLVMIAARAMGVATSADLRAYFRLPVADARARVTELVEAGDLLPATVEGWRHPAFVPAAPAVPRRLESGRLVSPFDPLLWERDRVERLFGFRYRIEIYTPEHRREHGYYVLPFLLDDRLAARFDLKADRASRTLQVLAAYREAPESEARLAAAASAELRRLAGWLGLETIAIGPRGDLAGSLRQEVRAGGG